MTSDISFKDFHGSRTILNDFRCFEIKYRIPWLSRIFRELWKLWVLMNEFVSYCKLLTFFLPESFTVLFSYKADLPALCLNKNKKFILISTPKLMKWPPWQKNAKQYINIHDSTKMCNHYPKRLCVCVCIHSNSKRIIHPLPNVDWFQNFHKFFHHRTY